MKKFTFIFTIFLILLLGINQTSLKAQFQTGYYGNYFQHIVTAANLLGTGNFSLIDNTLTNGYDSKKLLITHCYNPNYIHCNFNAAIYYNLSFSKWVLRAEHPSYSFPLGAAFNVLNTTANGTTFPHLTSAANVIGDRTIIDNAATNNNPDALVFITHNDDTLYSNSVANSVYYIDYKWTIINNNGTPFPVDRFYNVFVTSACSNAFVHNSNSANVYLNGTIIDNPALNGNPNATIFVTQRTLPITNNRTVGVYYNGTNWVIYNEEESNMLLSVSFNVLIADDLSAGINNYTNNNKIRIYPNPASDDVALTTNKTNNADLTLNIYNVVGSLVKSQTIENNNYKINIRDLINGIYTVEIKSKDWSEKQKLIIQK